MNKKLLSLIIGTGVLTLASCEMPHEHTFDLAKWEITTTHHWHESTCEHEGLASNLGEHTYGSDGKCTVCGYQKQTSRFNFSLRSDYCDLDNESVYDEGDEVELNLTLKEEFKSSLTLPNDVEVYSDGTLLTKGTDYNYVIEGEAGKLSLTVNGNIVVLAFNDQNEDSFKITEAQFADAMNISDETHIQYNLTAGFYSSFSIVMQQYDVEYSPNVTYRGSYSFDASRNGGSISCDYIYIEKENETYTEYHSDKSGIWTTSPTDEATFNGSKSLSLGWFPFISGFQLTYDRIKDNFNSVTNAYEVYFTYQEYNVKFEVTFYNGKLINVSYEGIFEADRGIFGNVDVSYIEKEVSISEAAKPKTYNVVFKDNEGNILNQQSVVKGEMPDISKVNVTDRITNDKVLMFKGWNKELAPATEDTTYVATYYEYNKELAPADVASMITAESLGDNLSFVLSFYNGDELLWCHNVAIADGKYESIGEYPTTSTHYGEEGATYADSNYTYFYSTEGDDTMAFKVTRTGNEHFEDMLQQELNHFTTTTNYVYDENFKMFISKNSATQNYLILENGKVKWIKSVKLNGTNNVFEADFTSYGGVEPFDIPDYGWTDQH